MTDRYVKGVLTVIAACLAALVLQNAVAPGRAAADCGTFRHDPCYVEIVGTSCGLVPGSACPVRIVDR